MAKPEKMVKLAQNHLNDEEVKYWVYGAFKSEIMGANTLRNGIFIATERQVFFYCKRTFGFDTESFPFSNISSLEIGKGALGHKINIIASGNKAEMSMISKGQIPEFTEYVRSKIGKSSAKMEGATETANDTIEELRKFKTLLDEGIISEEDFDLKKKQMLGI